MRKESFIEFMLRIQHNDFYKTDVNQAYYNKIDAQRLRLKKYNYKFKNHE